jgi:hypothetical protein
MFNVVGLEVLTEVTKNSHALLAACVMLLSCLLSFWNAICYSETSVGFHRTAWGSSQKTELFTFNIVQYDSDGSRLGLTSLKIQTGNYSVVSYQWYKSELF